MRDLRSLFAELQRRKVFRTAIAYAAVAWGVISVADVVSGLPLGLPDWTVTLVTVLAILGFPLVLTLEWVFEVTSEGVRRTSEADVPAEGKSVMLRAVAVGALAVVTVGLVGWYLRGPGPGDVRAGVSLEDGRVAPLPCDVSGGEELAAMGEGMVFLLGNRLRPGTESFRPLDPRTVLSFLDREAIDPTDAEGARRAALSLGAARYIRCDIRGLPGDEVHVSAALYHVGGDGEPVAAVSVEGDEAALASLADELAVRILTGSGGSASRLVREAGRSGDGVPLEAWKEYVEGEEAYRAGRFAEAAAAFRDAVAIDSGFALAHYRRSVAAGWDERHEEAAEALGKALAHSDRLAPLDHDLVEAASAYRSGKHAEAKRLFEDITRAYPEDLEAWYGLGEVFFHYGWLGGDPLARGDSALTRASELDPGSHHWDVLFHLSHVSGMERDLERFDSVTARMRSLGDDPFSPRTWVLFRGDAEALDSLAREIAEGALSTEPLAVFLAEVAPTLPRAEQVAEAFTGPGQPEAHRVLGHLKMAGTKVAAGKWHAAREALEEAARLRPAIALEMKAYLTLAAPPELVGGQVEAVAGDLEEWDGEAEADPGESRYPEAPHGGLHPWLRLYLLGLLEARLGETASALDRAEALGAAEAPEGLEEWLRDLEMVIRAEAARTEGEPERALELLEEAPLWTVYRLDARFSPIFGHFYPVFLRADLLRELDRPREALRWYEALEIPFWMPSDALGTRVLLGRARVLHAVDRVAEARELCEEARERWSGADVELRLPPECGDR